MNSTSQRIGSTNNSTKNGSNCQFHSKAKVSSNILHRGYRSPISPHPKSPLAKSVSPRERSPSSGKKSRRLKSFENGHEDWNSLSPLDGMRNGPNVEQNFFRYLQLNRQAENYSTDHLDCVDLLRRNWETAVDKCTNAAPNLPNVGKSLVHVYDEQTDDNCCESVVSVTSTTTASSSTSINNSDTTCSSLSSSTSLRSLFYYEENKDALSLESSSTSADLEHCNTPSLEASINGGFNHGVAVAAEEGLKPKFSIDEWLEQRILEQVFLTQ